MSQSERDRIKEEFEAGRYRSVIEIIEESREKDAWLLKYLGLAKTRLGEFDDGIDALITAMRSEAQPDAAPVIEVWSALGTAFEETGKPACARECFTAAAALDHRHRAGWMRKVEELGRREASPEDIAISRVFLRTRGDGPSLDRKVQGAKQRTEAMLYTPRWEGHSSTFLHVLREHSSFTPIMTGSGGGYLLMHGGKGCVIDPGHGFMRNFLEHHYGFGDIHAIVVTHGHDDHVMDLPAIASVLHKARLRRSVDLYMDETSYKAFRGHYLLASSALKLQPILKPGQRRRIFDGGARTVHMDVYRAEHRVPVLTSVARPTRDMVKTGRGVGVGFRLGFPGGREHYLLMPSDTRWTATIGRQYPRLRSQDVALLHVSSIGREAEWLRPGARRNSYMHPQHMGLLGVIGFIKELNPRYVLLSEKGMELEDVWDGIADAIRSAFASNEIVICSTRLGTKVSFDGTRVRLAGGYEGQARP